MSNARNKIEALLFNAARRMTIEELSQHTKIFDVDKIKEALVEIKLDYENRGGPVKLFEDFGAWKLGIKDEYRSVAEKVTTTAEMNKPLIETLAVIAWKYPIVQSEVIRIRHNKAYDHMARLEEEGFITRIKFGRTKKITLTEKFFDYFDLPDKERAREAFKAVVPVEVRERVEKHEQDITVAEKKIDDYEKEKQRLKEEKKKEEILKQELKDKGVKNQELGEEIEENVEVSESSDEAVEEEIKVEPEENIKEEEKDVPSEMPEVQESDEIPKQKW